MQATDLRALAESLGLLKPCVCCNGRLADCAGTISVCLVCGGTSRRLPTEAEVRAAIFAAGRRVQVYTSDRIASVVTMNTGIGSSASGFAEEGEAASNELALLALMRALERCR